MIKATDIISRVQKLLDGRRTQDAAELLSETARAGCPTAQAELAHWRIAGDILGRDLAKARKLLGQAGASGDRDSALLHASFLANGTGGPEDWPAAIETIRSLASHDSRAAAQLQLLKGMKLTQNGNPLERIPNRLLSDNPHVAVSEGMLKPEECRYLADAGAPALQPSVVVDPGSGRMVPHPIRKSDGAAFGVYSEDVVVSAINRRIAAFSGTRPLQGEPLQLLRYRPGGEYRAHMDALPGEPNQRVLTVILYLNDEYEGGETAFVRTDLTFRGKAGDALLFRNVTPEGRPDPMALHAGLPVRRGMKLIATRWIRKGPFTFPAPPPLLPAFA